MHWRVGLHLPLVASTPLALALTFACSPAQNSTTPAPKPSSATCGTRLRVPIYDAKLGYQHWHLTVNDHGSMQWNGQDVDSETLRRYMTQLSNLPAEAGVLVVHIEPKTSCKVVYKARSLIERNPLCMRDRCRQDKWNYRRPIVN